MSMTSTDRESGTAVLPARPAVLDGKRLSFLAALTVDAVGTGMFLPFSILYFVTVHGLSLATTGLLIGAANIVAIAALPACGSVLDRVGPRTFAIGNFLARGLGFGVYLVTGNEIVLALAFAVVAVGDRSWPPASQLYVAELVPPDGRAVWLGISRSLRTSGMAVGALASGVLATVWGRPGLLAVAAINGATFALGAAILVGVLTGRPRAVPGERRSFVAQLRDPVFRRLLIAFAPSTLVYVAVLTVLPAYVVTELGAPPWVASAILTVNTATTIVAQVPLLALAKRIGQVRAAAAGTGAILAGYLVLSVAPAVGPFPAVLIGLGGALVISAGADLFYPSSVAHLTNVAPDGSQGRWLSAYQMEFALANGVGAAALMALAETMPAVLWPVLAAVAAVGFVLQRGLGDGETM